MANRGVKGNPYLNRNDDPRLKRTGFGFGLGSSKSLKKGMMFNTDFPEGLAKIPTGHEKFQGILVRAVGIRAELDEKALPLEAQLPHLRPVEGVDLSETLRRRKVSASEPGNA